MERYICSVFAHCFPSADLLKGGVQYPVKVDGGCSISCSKDGAPIFLFMVYIIFNVAFNQFTVRGAMEDTGVGEEKEIDTSAVYGHMR